MIMEWMFRKQQPQVRPSLSYPEREEQLGVMRRPFLWPMFPTLPVKRLVPTMHKNYEAPECGVLVFKWTLDDGLRKDVSAVVYDRDQYFGTDRKLSKEVVLAKYNSLEELVDDGWLVD